MHNPGTPPRGTDHQTIKGTLMKTTLSRCALLAILGTAPLTGCRTVPETGRLQYNILSEAQENQLGADAYRQVLETNEISSDTRMTEIVRRVGERISRVANKPEFEWEFNLIDSPQVNAFCLPGGKIAVYTGILPIMDNEAGMAAVMGHEVAHALARHGGERVSQGMTVQVITEVMGAGMKNANPQARDGILKGFGVITQYGVLLPFSRSHELEADSWGLKLAAQAGYDPREAVALWQRMEAASQGKPPEFMSTHPSEQHRINDLQELMPAAMQLYDSAPQKYGLGEKWGTASQVSSAH